MTVAPFKERWGLPEDDAQKKREKYLNRLLALTSDRPEANPSALRLFSFASGFHVTDFGKGLEYRTGWFDAREYFTQVIDIHELALRLEYFLNSSIPSATKRNHIHELTNRSGVGIRIIVDGDNYITYPEGDPLLDEQIEKSLRSLHGNSRNEFIKALMAYKNADWVQC